MSKNKPISEAEKQLKKSAKKFAKELAKKAEENEELLLHSAVEIKENSKDDVQSFLKELDICFYMLILTFMGNIFRFAIEMNILNFVLLLITTITVTIFAAATEKLDNKINFGD